MNTRLPILLTFARQLVLAMVSCSRDYPLSAMGIDEKRQDERFFILEKLIKPISHTSQTRSQSALGLGKPTRSLQHLHRCIALDTVCLNPLAGKWVSTGDKYETFT